MDERTIASAPALSRPVPRAGLLKGGAPRFWHGVLGDSLPAVAAAVPPGSQVLEVGYGDGVLTCWLADTFQWRVVGLDITDANRAAARGAADRFGVADRVDFQVCRPEETRRHRGSYDAVFIKTVLYSSATLDEYAAWLDWIGSVLRPGGMLVNYETGRANGFVQAYRRWRGRVYTDLRLYTAAEERLYDERFEILFRRYYGGLSQFLAPLPGVYEAAVAVERTMQARSADNCFAVAIVARHRGGPAIGGRTA